MLERLCYALGMIRQKMPRDVCQIAKKIVSLVTEEQPYLESTPEIIQPNEPDQKNPHAVALGRLGGLKGGKARAKKLTPEQRKEIAQIAATARWKKTDI